MGESAPTHDDLVLALLDLKGDLDALRLKFNLTTRQALDFTDDPAVQQRLESWERVRARLSRIKALDHQDAAADALRATLTELDNPVERRRAASALARLARAVLTPPREPRPDDQTPEPRDPPPGPDRNPSHHRLALNIAQSIAAAANDPDQLLTLHRQLADDATIAGEPAPRDPEEFLDAPALEALADLHRFENETRLFTSPDEERIPPIAAAYRLAFQRTDRSHAHLILRFRRRTEHHDWLVSELTIGDSPPN